MERQRSRLLLHAISARRPASEGRPRLLSADLLPRRRLARVDRRILARKGFSAHRRDLARREPRRPLHARLGAERRRWRGRAVRSSVPRRLGARRDVRRRGDRRRLGARRRPVSVIAKRRAARADSPAGCRQRPHVARGRARARSRERRRDSGVRGDGQPCVRPQPRGWAVADRRIRLARERAGASQSACRFRRSTRWWRSTATSCSSPRRAT